MRDPISAELHWYCGDHARKFNFDLATICSDHRERSRDYGALSAEQMEERIQQSLKKDPLWKKATHQQGPSPASKRTGERTDGCH